jgi:LysM repeat protein
MRGDNPVAIARKLNVNYDELMKLNKISDPKKLKPGHR